MNAAPELYKLVQAYISGEVSRAELESWLVPHLQELLDPRSTAQDLVAEIEIGLAEYSHDDISEEELKRGLAEFLTKNSPVLR